MADQYTFKSTRQSLAPLTSDKRFDRSDLLLYVHGKQLRSGWDGQISQPHCSWASLPEEVYQYLAYILLPVTDNKPAEEKMAKSRVQAGPEF